MRVALAALAALALAARASAAPDPACVGATPADPAAPLDARAGVKLCAPTLDDQGAPLAADELETCSLYLDGALRLSFAAAPGALYRITPPATWPKRAALAATCAGPGGSSALTPTYDARLRTGRPAAPAILP